LGGAGEELRIQMLRRAAHRAAATEATPDRRSEDYYRGARVGAGVGVGVGAGGRRRVGGATR
jgi:hypothetical protein